MVRRDHASGIPGPRRPAGTALRVQPAMQLTLGYAEALWTANGYFP